MPPLLAIIADDLTGALDAAGPFAVRGLSTRVALALETLPDALEENPQVVAVNTASREIAPALASGRVREALALFPEGTRLFKKIDSRFKGNIEAELAVFPHPRFMILPAIPEFGRFVEDGHIKGFGLNMPLAIAPLLGRLASRCEVPDIGSAAVMKAACRTLPEDFLLVGARGLANALAETLFNSLTPPAYPPIGALTMVIGSRDPITLEQIKILKARIPDAVVIKAPDGLLPRSCETSRQVPKLTILQATQGHGAPLPVAVAQALAASLQASCLDGRDGLLISGGATAETILASLGIGHLEVLGEIAEGLPVSTAKGLTVITKSGGFGESDTLFKVVAGQLDSAIP